MPYIKRKISNNRFLLTDAENRNIAVGVRGDEARILFADADENLLKAAEKEAFHLGCRRMTCDFYDAFRRFNAFLTENGYESDRTKKIIGVNVKDLFASKAVRKSLVIDFGDTDFIPFGELLLYQLDELCILMEKAGVPISRDEIGSLDQDLSGIAYDKNRRIQAFILVSVKADDILIECLYGVSRNNPKYIMTALQGFGKEMIRCGITGMYEKICMLEYSDTVRPLVQRLLDGKYELMELGNVMHSEHIPEEIMDDDTTPEEKKDRLSMHEAAVIYDREILRRPYQGNINWKADWKINN